MPRCYETVDKLLADPEVDAVYIATPPASHPFITKLAAVAGKAIYVEKPMASTASAAKMMADFCTHFQVPLFVAYYRRALPLYRELKRLLREGAIGKVRLVELCSIRRPSARDRSSENWRISGNEGGYFFDLGSHQLDLLDFLLGPILAASGFATNLGGIYSVWDTISANFRFPCDALGTASWCFVAHEDKDLIRVTGEKGGLEIPMSPSESARLVTGEPGGEISFPVPESCIQEPAVHEVIEWLTTDWLAGKPTPLGQFHYAHALRTNFVMDKIVGRI